MNTISTDYFPVKTWNWKLKGTYNVIFNIFILKLWEEAVYLYGNFFGTNPTHGHYNSKPSRMQSKIALISCCQFFGQAASNTDLLLSCKKKISCRSICFWYERSQVRIPVTPLVVFWVNKMLQWNLNLENSDKKNLIHLAKCAICPTFTIKAKVILVSGAKKHS